MDELTQSGETIRIETLDADADGFAEVLISSPHLTLLVEPARGGGVVEVDARAKAFNLGNTLTRRPEAYHRKLATLIQRQHEGAATIHGEMAAKEEGLADLLHYDSYRRGSFLDHWLSPTTTLGDFSRQGSGTELALAAYEPRISREGRTSVLELESPREQIGIPVRVRKRFRLAANAPRLTVEYRLESQSTESGRFGVEFNLAFYMGPPPDRIVEINGQPAADSSLFAVAETPGVHEVRVVDAWLGLAARLTLDPPATLWRCPVQTISQSEGGYERVAQQVALLPHWTLGSGAQVFDVRFILSIESWEAAGG